MKRFLAMLLLVFAGTVFCQESTLIAENAPLWAPGSPPDGWRPMPYRAGSWYDPARSGSGWALERFQPLAGQVQPFYSATAYVYDQAGNPQWLLLTDTFRPASWMTLFQTGEIGRITGPLFTGRGGACLGCPYLAPDVFPSSYGDGALVFRGGGSTMDVYAGGVLKESVTPSSHILFGGVTSHLVKIAFQDTYYGSGVNAGRVYRRSRSIRQVQPPAWVSRLSSGDSNVAKIPLPSPSTMYFVYGGVSAEDVLIVFDGTDDSLIEYTFLAGVATVEGGVRVSYRMSSQDSARRIVMIDENTFIWLPYKNSVDPQTGSEYVGSSRIAVRLVKSNVSGV